MTYLTKEVRREKMIRKYLDLAKKAEEEGDDVSAAKFRLAAKRCETT